MAKTGAGQRVRQQGEGSSRTMVDFAEDLGRLLGSAQAKASSWLNQRKNVIDELTQLRDTANQLLRDLTGQPTGARAGGRKRGRPAASSDGTAQTPASGARRTGRRKMSPAARKEVSRRMRKYWAERRKAKGAQA